MQKNCHLVICIFPFLPLLRLFLLHQKYFYGQWNISFSNVMCTILWPFHQICNTYAPISLPLSHWHILLIKTNFTTATHTHTHTSVHEPRRTRKHLQFASDDRLCDVMLLPSFDLHEPGANKSLQPSTLHAHTLFNPRVNDAVFSINMQMWWTQSVWVSSRFFDESVNLSMVITAEQVEKLWWSAWSSSLETFGCSSSSLRRQTRICASSLQPFKLFQRFVFCIKAAAERTRRTKRRGDEKSTTSLHNPLSRRVNKFSDVVWEQHKHRRGTLWNHFCL